MSLSATIKNNIKVKETYKMQLDYYQRDRQQMLVTMWIIGILVYFWWK